MSCNTTLSKLNILLFWCVVSFAIGAIFGYYTKPCNTTVSTPVEENVIDSLATTKDSIKLKVKELDSIKNAKVIEVSALDNDSTIKLFYELVKE